MIFSKNSKVSSSQTVEEVKNFTGGKAVRIVEEARGGYPISSFCYFCDGVSESKLIKGEQHCVYCMNNKGYSNKELMTREVKEDAVSISSDNNGGSTDYYKLSSAPFPITDFDDFAEWREFNGFQFNIGKVVWTFNVGRHSGTDYVRDLNKIIHYANKELERLERN